MENLRQRGVFTGLTIPTMKIVGAALIFFAALFCAFAMTFSEKKRTDRLEGYFELVSFILFQIENYSRTLPEILAVTDKGILKKCGIEDGKIPDLENEDFFIGKTECRILRSFFDGLGRHCKNDEIKYCRACISELGALADKRKSEYPKRRKMTFILCVSAALAVIIIML